MNKNLSSQNHLFVLRLGLFKIVRIKSECLAINHSNVDLYKKYTQTELDNLLAKVSYFKIDDIKVDPEFIERIEESRKVYKGSASNLVNYFINLNDGYDKYIEAMKSKHKKELRREVRRFYEAFETVEIVYFNKLEEVDCFITDMKKIHIKSWKSGTLNELQKSTVNNLAQKGEWLGVIIYANGAPISYMHGIFNNEGEYFLIYNGYDDGFKHLKPGKVLISKIIENHKPFNIRSIDFGSGSSTYKKIFCNDVNNIYSALITNNNSKYAFIFQVQVWLDAFYMMIKHHSEKLNIAHKLRKLVRGQ